VDEIPALSDLQDCLRKLGGTFFEWVQSQVAPRDWISATLEARYAADDSFSDHKMRVQTADGETISLRTPPPIAQLVSELTILRRALGWYSMKMRVEKNGNITVEYGYDPKAVEDPSFFED
jgi:hypothetical protein